MTRTRHRLLPLLAGLAAALLVLLAYAAVLRLAFTSSYRGANDFYIPWRATQALLWEGGNPYGPEVTAEIQQTLFDRTRGPEEHQFDFAYPLTLAPLLAPYTLFDYKWAQPLWQATLHLLLVGALLLWVRSWRDDFPSPVAFAALALWTLSVYPAARAFLLGQVAVLVFAALALAFWALVRRHDVLAGTALAVATVKPQLAFLIVPLLLAVAWRAERRRIVWGFAATWSILVLVSLALHPAWPLDFLRRLGEYSHYTSLGSASDSPSPLELLTRGLGPLDSAVARAILALALVVPLLVLSWRAGRSPDWVGLGSLALTVSAVVAPRAATTDQVLLLLPLLWLLSFFRRGGALLAVLIWLAMWIGFFATVQGDQEALVLRLLLPLTLFFLWLWPGLSRMVPHRASAKVSH